MANTKREIVRIVKGWKLRDLGHTWRHELLQKDLLEGNVNGKRGGGRSRITWGDNIKKWKKMNYARCKRVAYNRQKWKQWVMYTIEHDEPTLW